MILLNGLWNKLRGRLKNRLKYKDNFLMWGRSHLNSLVHFCLLPFLTLWSLSFSPPFQQSFQLVLHKVNFNYSSQWCLGIVVPIRCFYQRGTRNLWFFCIWHALIFLCSVAAPWDRWKARQQEILRQLEVATVRLRSTIKILSLMVSWPCQIESLICWSSQNFWNVKGQKLEQ